MSTEPALDFTIPSNINGTYQISTRMEPSGEFKTLKQIEREYLERLLFETRNNKTQAAKAMGITMKTLYNKLHEYGIFEQFRKHRHEEVAEEYSVI